MINQPVEAAVIALQKRALATRDLYELDRIDRALDELLRNPDERASAASAISRVRSALGHAYETIESRRKIAPLIVLDDHTDRCSDDPGYRIAEIILWLRTEPTLATSDREILCHLADGEDAKSLAEWHGLPVARMRERISRARRNGRQIWNGTALAA